MTGGNPFANGTASLFLAPFGVGVNNGIAIGTNGTNTTVVFDLSTSIFFTNFLTVTLTGVALVPADFRFDAATEELSIVSI